MFLKKSKNNVFQKNISPPKNVFFNKKMKKKLSNIFFKYIFQIVHIKINFKNIFIKIKISLFL